MSKGKISLKELRKQLTQCLFNPKKPGPMSILAEMNDAYYWESRAIEAIREAQSLGLNEFGQVLGVKGAMRLDKLRQAVQLILLALVKHAESSETTREGNSS